MKPNTQIPVKAVKNDGAFLLVHSIFPTIQGEGPFAGWPATFIRLAGCNIQCPGCDTEYTEGSLLLSVLDIVANLNAIPDKGKERRMVVITGGEPFRQNIAMLANTLVLMGIRVQIETNGTLPPSRGLHHLVAVVCSPKTGNVNPELISRIDAWKYVARADDLMPDGLPSVALGHSAKPHLARPRNLSPVYLQPMDEQDPIKNKANMDAVVKSCLDNGYRLCIQMHKIVGVE